MIFWEGRVHPLHSVWMCFSWCVSFNSGEPALETWNAGRAFQVSSLEAVWDTQQGETKSGIFILAVRNMVLDLRIQHQEALWDVCGNWRIWGHGHHTCVTVFFPRLYQNFRFFYTVDESGFTA